jgi:hypothetical protein
MDTRMGMIKPITTGWDSGEGEQPLSKPDVAERYNAEPCKLNLGGSTAFF